MPVYTQNVNAYMIGKWVPAGLNIPKKQRFTFK